MSRARAHGALIATCLTALIAAGAAQAQTRRGESPRTGALSFRLGNYNPQRAIDARLREPAYKNTFGDSAMLLFELQYDRYLWQGFGAAGVGFSAGYAEKYGNATVVGDPGATTSVKAAIHVAPMKLFGLYNFDYPAQEWNVPLVPYVRLGLAYVPYWITKGGEIEVVNGVRGQGGKWGWTAAGGLSFMLDFLEPRIQRDFDYDFGVNHTLVFAEYSILQADSFGGAGLDLSSNHFMFGLKLEF